MPPTLQVDLSTLNLESDVRVTCDVGYLSANFSLPRPLLSVLYLSPMYATDVKRRQNMSDAHRRLVPATLGAGA